MFILPRKTYPVCAPKTQEFWNIINVIADLMEPIEITFKELQGDNVDSSQQEKK